MSTQVTTAFVQQYSANVQMLSQQKGSLLRDAVRVEAMTGKNGGFLMSTGPLSWSVGLESALSIFDSILSRLLLIR